MRFSYLGLVPALLVAGPPAGPDLGERLATAVASGRVAWRLSEPPEIKEALGAPLEEQRGRDGGLEILTWIYGPEARVVFWRDAGKDGPFVLAKAQVRGEWSGPRPGDLLVLREGKDLAKLRTFTGLQNVDASRVDLRQEGERLRLLPFDTSTRWPGKERLPEGFDPLALMEKGRNPGLGVRALHARGLDGRGVEIGIIDQPLVPDHPEVAGRLKMAGELEVAGIQPQMHGPAVSSLAAGRTCGVAPGATVHYVAMAMWKSPALGNKLYLQALERLLELKRTGGARIRVVSISYGGFGSAPDAAAWNALVARAEAEGVLVITCDGKGMGLEWGLLRPLPAGDRERPEGYSKGSYGGGLLVPGDGRTFAHHLGTGAFAYAPMGGMSWGAPWLAGLAALGFQANPALTPAQIRTFLVQSATEMPYGRVVNPEAFMGLCRSEAGGSGPGKRS
ncbi:MAG: S8/S53 family peptidase [Acidobacteria bacterium]|nr:S8/S53 family peptidase [Acidobacteriota bacterium]